MHQHLAFIGYCCGQFTDDGSQHRYGVRIVLQEIPDPDPENGPEIAALMQNAQEGDKIYLMFLTW